MQYFFIFGNNPSLSAAELCSWLDARSYDYSIVAAEYSFLVLEIAPALPHDVLRSLGGTIKFGHAESLRGELNRTHLERLIETKTKASLHALPGGKFHFGFSVYPKDRQYSFELRGLGLDLKKYLKELGTASRLVMSKQENLSSVVVQKNKLVSEQGIEFVVLKSSLGWFVGTTIAVQPFEDLSKRDFGRPGRDDYSGMLPPKLAQVMLNIAGVTQQECVWDPFCGSGTVAQEALLMGVKKIVASDKSAQAIKDTRQNIDWLSQQYSVDVSGVTVVESDVRTAAERITQSVTRVVTEPYLGPPARGRRTEAQVKQIIKELTPLYRSAFDTYAKVLQVNARVVMVFPAFRVGRRVLTMPRQEIIPHIFKLVRPLAPEYSAVYAPAASEALVYKRNDQAVIRHIVVCEYAG